MKAIPAAHSAMRTDRTGKRFLTQCRLQYSLRSMLLGTALAAAAIGSVSRRAREQEAAVRLVRAEGGEVHYDFQERPAGSFDLQCSPSVPRFFSQALGVDYWADVVHVGIGDLSDDPQKSFSKAAIRSFSAFPRIKYLSLFHASLDDGDMSVVSRLGALEMLWIGDGSKLTDEGAARLKQLRRLKHLLISDSRVSLGHGAAEAIASLKSLELLGLSNARVTSATFAKLRPIPNLSILYLDGNRGIDDDAMRVVEEMTLLEKLTLGNTSVSSKGIAGLQHLRKLRLLDLSGNSRIDNDALAHLGKITSLEWLDLHGTGISSAVAESLTALVNLSDLDLSENPRIDERVLAPLAALPRLRRLYLRGTAIGNGRMTKREAVECFRAFTTLLFLDLSGTGADTDSIQAVLPNCAVIGPD